MTSISPVTTPSMLPDSNSHSISKFSEQISASFSDFLEKAHAADKNVKDYAMGEKDISQIAPTFSTLFVEIEATKTLAEAGVGAIKNILNTNL
jgi:flagellar hook-basal body complex protein FliE